jgi:NADPH2:quinone reductase
MKAIRVNEWGGPEVMKLEDVPDPVAGAGQVTVRVRAAGVNPVDAYIRTGAYGGSGLPYTPGSDAAGDILAVGPDVVGLKPGGRVYVAGVKGAYAEQVVCDAAKAHPLPDSVSYEQGAAIGVPYATAYRGLFQRGDAKAGDVVLIHGASGGVGAAAVQIGVAAGMILIGTAGTEEGLRFLLNQGVHYPLNHHEEGYLDKALEVTMGRGVDVILEMLANVNLGRDLKVLAPGGRVVVIGSRGPVEIDPRETMRREADIRGLLLGVAPPEDVAAAYAAITAGLANGTLNPVVGKRIPLAEAARSHKEVMEGGHIGKIVLIP